VRLSRQLRLFEESSVQVDDSRENCCDPRRNGQRREHGLGRAVVEASARARRVSLRRLLEATPISCILYLDVTDHGFAARIRR
jgi:hypothetical protein